MSFRQSKTWRKNPFGGLEAPELDRRLKGAEVVNGKLRVHSLSGHERNHLFMNDSGKQYTDVSLVSGLDNVADSRGFVTFDFDRDGFLDIGMVNANDPLINLYRNNSGNSASNHRFIAVRFVGANQSATTATGKTCRDGYGAIVEIELPNGLKLKQEHRCGEGYGTQNSATMHVGIGAQQYCKRFTVKWPSGKSHSLNDVAAGSLVTCFESKTDSSNESTFQVQRYRDQETLTGEKPGEQKSKSSMLSESILAELDLSTESECEYRLFITMATTCPICRSHLPDLHSMKNAIGDDVALFAIPIDDNDTERKLEFYVGKYEPPYALTSFSKQFRDELLNAAFGTSAALPSAFIIDQRRKRYSEAAWNSHPIRRQTRIIRS